jgi:hypothetical protein
MRNLLTTYLIPPDSTTIPATRTAQANQDISARRARTSSRQKRAMHSDVWMHKYSLSGCRRVPASRRPQIPDRAHGRGRCMSQMATGRHSRDRGGADSSGGL